MNALTPVSSNAEAYRASTDAAGLCREIVMQTAKTISGRKHVAVEGWEAIAIAHGCAASALDVERVTDEGASGFKCVGVVRRMSDGQEISRGEGFLGDDETMWAKRPVYARRAMAQTRAISRACRSAFAHVVVMIDRNLATTPAEEITIDPSTGEVIDGPQEPPARAKLEGPHSSKTNLRNAVNDIIAKVRAAQSEREIDAIKEEGKRTINQAIRDWPVLINGDPNIAEDVGLKGAIELRRATLKSDEGDGQFQMLLDSMKSCETLASLTNWMGANEAILDELGDAERRAFEKERDQFEAGLMQVANMNAG